MGVVAARKIKRAELGTVKLTVVLPPSVKGVTYVKNHHYIELEDTAGNKIKLNASGILVGKCDECKTTVFALHNSGLMACTHCSGAVKWAWAKPQLAFVAEHESEFMGMDAGKNPPRSRKK